MNVIIAALVVYDVIASVMDALRDIGPHVNIHLAEMKGSFCDGYVNGEGGRTRGWFCEHRSYEIEADPTKSEISHKFIEMDFRGWILS